jgi:hypothetical protein
VEPIIHRIIDEMKQKRGSGNRSSGERQQRQVQAFYVEQYKILSPLSDPNPKGY